MSLAEEASREWDRSFPRVSGDEPWSVKLEVEEVEFSPRERG